LPLGADLTGLRGQQRTGVLGVGEIAVHGARALDGPAAHRVRSDADPDLPRAGSTLPEGACATGCHPYSVRARCRDRCRDSDVHLTQLRHPTPALTCRFAVRSEGFEPPTS
jgi:hypothetical protein